MKQLVKDIIKYYEYAKYTAKADLDSEVTNSYLDWFWWILEPVCHMFIYYFIFGKIFRSSEPYFLVFIFSGITMWTFFNKCATTSVNLIRNSKSTITKVYIPKPILLIEKMFVNLFKMLISCGIVIALMIPYKIHLDYHIFGIVPVLIVFFIFTYGCCCVLMHYGVYVEDLAYIVSIVLDMLFYFTGIFYSISNSFDGVLGILIERCNPLAFLICASRNALLYREDIPSMTLFFWLIISIIIAVFGTKLVYKNENSYVKII